MQASWLGGSYIADPLEPLICKLSIPLASGAHLDLDMSKVFLNNKKNMMFIYVNICY